MGSVKTFSFGACKASGYSPKRERWNSDTKVINIKIGFEEALKLSLALDESVRKLNKYKRNAIEGKRAAISLVLNLRLNRLAVMETKL